MKYFRALRIEDDLSYSYLKDVNVNLGLYEIVKNVKDATPHVMLFSHKEGYSSLTKFMYENGFNFEPITEEVYNSYYNEESL